MDIISLSSGSKGNSYIVRDSGDTLLIEAGLPPKKLKEGLWDYDVDMADIDLCLISHVHQDHYKSAEFLSDRGVSIILPEVTDEQIQRLPRKDRVNYIEANKMYREGNWIVRAFDLEHDGVVNYGYFVMNTQSEDKLFYATDTMYIKYKPEGVNYWLVEVNFQDKYLEEAIKEGRMDRDNMRRIKRSHMSLATAKTFFSKQDLSDTREIWLLHLSDRNSNPTEVRKEIQKTTGKEVYLA
jgi:phosphoribosyl 1,2-cyclic phosphodiesterase